MTAIRSKLKKPILIIFDEVERITFDLSSEEHWKNGKDFIHFWRTMRAVFQKDNRLFTYLIVSTNPKSIETASIRGEENPLFSQIPSQYIPPFSVQQTKEMVERIANVMGIEFDDILFSQLTDDFGGHPFLIRMICSLIHRMFSSKRPIKIDKTMYHDAKGKFNKEFMNYIKMVIIVLEEHYSDEFDMLTFLAIGDIKIFNDFASTSIDYTNHLVGYNILAKNGNNYYFKIEAIKNYLLERNKYKRINMTNDERIAEISERRNLLEPKLRTVVRTLLFAKFGELEARNNVLEIFGKERKEKCDMLNLKDLFDPNVSHIYFEDLRKIINKYWDAFSNIFQCDKNKCNDWLIQINKYRADAHAKNIDEEEMAYFRICISNIEKFTSNYI